MEFGSVDNIIEYQSMKIHNSQNKLQTQANIFSIGADIMADEYTTYTAPLPTNRRAMK